MVPDKFNMVDMGGIDLIMMQGEEVPGLYMRLVESIAQCRYQCLYNWLFDGVVIPPAYVKMEVNEDDEVAINEGVTVSPDDVIHIYSLDPVLPEIVPLLAEENGTYNAPSGVDGFNPVTVDVPSYTPVINSITITENGNYSAPSGVDGYSPVVVNVDSQIRLYTNYRANLLTPYKFNQADEVLCTTNNRPYTKYTSSPAYGCYAKNTHQGTPVLVSTVLDAVQYKAAGSGPWTDQGTFVYNGVTYYVSGTAYGWGGSSFTNTNGSLVDFVFQNTSSLADIGLEFLLFILSLPDEERDYYKVGSGASGVIEIPTGYDGFGTLFLE